MSLKGSGEGGSTERLFKDSGYYHGDSQSHSTSIDEEIHTSFSSMSSSQRSAASGVSSKYQKKHLIHWSLLKSSLPVGIIQSNMNKTSHQYSGSTPNCQPKCILFWKSFYQWQIFFFLLYLY